MMDMNQCTYCKSHTTSAPVHFTCNHGPDRLPQEAARVSAHIHLWCLKPTSHLIIQSVKQHNA
jgi:hypothetical protein